jgi:hypothetical protein
MNDFPSHTGISPAPSHYKRYLSLFWRERVLLVIGAVFGLIAGMVAVHLIPYKYEASLVVRPPDSSSSGGGLLSQFSGGALGGLLSGGDVFSGADQSDFDEFQALLDSNELSQTLAQKHPEILHTIFHRQWNYDAKRWEQSPLTGPIKDALRSLFGFPAWHPPTGEDLKKYLSDRIDVATDFKTGMATITYSDRDPAFAKALLWEVYRETDSLVRAKQKAVAQNRIAFLEKKLPTVSEADLHYVLIRLLSDEEQKLLTAEADKAFSAQPVDIPIVSQTPSSPPILAILIGVTALGLGLAGLFVVCSDYFNWTFRFPMTPGIRRAFAPSQILSAR